MTATLLKATNLVKHFGGKRAMLSRGPLIRAVDGVSLDIQAGETFAIVGESGCGKSTLARMLVRLIDPTSGAVEFDGRDIAKLSPRDMRGIRRDLQFIFQDPFASLNPRMTVGTIVGEPLWLDGASSADRSAKVASLLALVGLPPEAADRYPHEFSGGQRQRIGIARALAGSPKLLIGDEPVSALDVSIQAQIINLLEDLKASLGLTLVIVAHDLAVIRHMSDRVAVMYLGEIVETAPTDALFEAPLHPYTQALMAAIPAPTPSARRDRPILSGDVPSPAAPPPGCRFHTRCPHVRDRCRVDRPQALPADISGTPGERTVACHFWREIAATGTTPVVAGNISPRFTNTLALYRRGRPVAATP